MTTQKRATRGGEFGPNGIWYNGGEFIATTELLPVSKNERDEDGAIRGTRKAEIGPYTWVIAPVGMVSLYSQLAGTVGKIHGGEYVKGQGWVGGWMIINTNPAALRYVGRTLAEVEAMAAAYNLGIRWIAVG